ncbi:MAG: response regulator transcription factor [Sarcina sp.]
MYKDINILVVEDDVDINSLLRDILSKQDYKITSAYSGSEAKMCLEKIDYDIMLLDLMLPGFTGEEIIKYIRKDKTMPIIVLSAKTAQADKINVLKLGADDYVSKPFDVDEVLARVEAQLRRYKKFSNEIKKDNLLNHKNLTLDKDTLEVKVNGKQISLTVREFGILELLMSYPKKVFTKGNLFEHVWKDEFLGDDNTINVHISNLRSKIGSVDSENEYIKTVWAIGFKMSE